MGAANASRAATEYDFGEDDCCWNCGGEGFVADCQDEIACLYPEYGCELCMRRCDYCNSPKPTGGPQ